MQMDVAYHTSHTFAWMAALVATSAAIDSGAVPLAFKEVSLFHVLVFASFYLGHRAFVLPVISSLDQHRRLVSIPSKLAHNISVRRIRKRAFTPKHAATTGRFVMSCYPAETNIDCAAK